MELPGNVFDLPRLRDRERVFEDRSHAGEVLADLLATFRGSGAMILAVPAGGVPVASVLAQRLGLELDVAVVSKITLPWNTEAGYGAVAFDGTVRINEGMLSYAGLLPEQVEEGKKRTAEKVHRRMKLLRGERPFPDLASRPAILVDDGIATGFTLLTAVSALKNSGAASAIVAAPTGHRDAVNRIAALAHAVYCANIRKSRVFAVADAYVHWSDVEENSLLKYLNLAGGRTPAPAPSPST